MYGILINIIAVTAHYSQTLGIRSRNSLHLLQTHRRL
jgi:hypothetical protein